ncbi:MAG: amidohydrolase family protein [Lentisphaeria bacterium]|nr:amidohydrolase family protein [Lentisphaeria bacterium]
MSYTGNIVTPDSVFYGEVVTDGNIISGINKFSEIKSDADWVVAGFVDIHTHGLEYFSAEEADGVRGMTACAGKYGVCSFCPTLSCNTEAVLLRQVSDIRDIIRDDLPGAKVAGIHLEGPWLNPEHCGGMVPEFIRIATASEADKYLAAADGTLKLLTIAPEVPGAYDVIPYFARAGVTVSAGHTGLLPVDYEKAVASGIKQFCHLFDTYDLPEDHGGVRQPAITDLALCDDRVMKEIIMDGLHVPPELVKLARRAAGADHVIAITDSLQGAGLKYGKFQEAGGWYIVREGDVARRESDNVITGSSLTMNRAFFNMVTRFGFSMVEASKAASANPAAAIGLGDVTGKLQVGFLADITVLAPDLLTVKYCSAFGE